MPRKLGNWLQSYAIYTDISEAPVAMNFWTGVSTIGGALRRQVWIDEIKFTWIPCFYIIFVSPPGIVTKSSTINVGMDLLKKVPGVIVGPTSMTWQGLLKGFEESKQLIPLKPLGTNIMDQDFLSTAAVTIGIRELGTFLNMKDGELISVLIDLWDGIDTFERWLRTSENTSIENPFLNIIAATTPSWIVENFADIAVGGGLASRIVFVYADKKRQLIPLISSIVDPHANDDLKEALIHDLEEISKLKGKFTLTPGAIDIIETSYVDQWENDTHLANPRLQGYRARKQSHMMKLCMVLSASESDDLIITEKHVQVAKHVLTGVEADMLQVFTSIGKPLTTRHMDELTGILRVQRKMTKSDLWRLAMTSMSAKEFADAMEGLMNANYCSVVNEAGAMLIYYTKTNDDERDALLRRQIQEKAYGFTS